MANPNYWYAKKFKAYAEKTRHLCLAEHGAYNLLLDHYYESRGKSAAFSVFMGEANASGLLRVCMCQTDEERNAVLSVVRQFFRIGDDGFLHNDPADEEMGIGANVSAARSAAGKLGAEIKKQKAIEKQNLSNGQASASANGKQIDSKEVSKAQDSNNNKEQLTATSKTTTNSNPLVGQKLPDPVVVIFAYWQKVMESPRSVLDKNRRGLIERALKTHGPADVCRAIRGCSKTPHNMGVNDRRTKYNGLSLILRNAEKIDQFIRNDETAPRAGGAETIEQQNARILAELSGQGDGTVIEMSP